MLTALFIACTEPATAPAASVDEIDAFWMAVGDPSDWTLPSVDESGDYSAFPQSERNPINEAKVELGRQLFYETGLAAAGVHADNVGTWSCASCHDPASGFRSGNTIGRGIGEGAEGQGADREMVREYADKLDHADISPMSEMTIINAGYRAEISGWQGEFDSVNDPMAYDIPRNSLLESGHDGLEAFIQAGLGAHGFWGDDAAVAPEASVLNPASADYDAWLELFRAAFPGEHPDRLINQTNTALALAAFVRTVVPSEAPFQKMLRSPASDEAPMSSAAVRGATLFFGEARCSACPSSPGLEDLLEAAASAWIKRSLADEATGKGPLDFELADAFTGLVLEAAVGHFGDPKDAFVHFGHEERLKGGNHLRTVRREVDRADVLRARLKR